MIQQEFQQELILLFLQGETGFIQKGQVLHYNAVHRSVTLEIHYLTISCA